MEQTARCRGLGARILLIAGICILGAPRKESTAAQTTATLLSLDVIVTFMLVSASQPQLIGSAASLTCERLPDAQQEPAPGASITPWGASCSRGGRSGVLRISIRVR